MQKVIGMMALLSAGALACDPNAEYMLCTFDTDDVRRAVIGGKVGAENTRMFGRMKEMFPHGEDDLTPFDYISINGHTQSKFHFEQYKLTDDE